MGMTDPAESLDDFLDKTNAPEKTPFAITDDKLADWAVAKIVRRLAVIEANKKLATQRKQQVDDWLAIATHDAEAEITYFEELLRPYLETRLKDYKSKSLKLPSGVVSLRSAGTEYTIDGEKIKADNQELLDFAQKSAPEFLKANEYVAWGELKEKLIPSKDGRVILADTGEILDFMAAWTPPDNISVKGVLR